MYIPNSQKELRKTRNAYFHPGLFYLSPTGYYFRLNNSDVQKCFAGRGKEVFLREDQTFWEVSSIF